MNREGLLGRAASSSYLPQSGTAHKAMVADLLALFVLCAVDGFVAFAMTTFVITADFGAASVVTQSLGIGLLLSLNL